MASQITSLTKMFTQPFIQVQIKENIKAPRHWPLCGNSPVAGEFPAQMASDAENVSIWWRYHEYTSCDAGQFQLQMSSVILTQNEIYKIFVYKIFTYIFISHRLQTFSPCSDFKQDKQSW